MKNGQKSHMDKDVEELVINTVKIKLIRKFEEYLEREGKSNLRKLFLVPVFTIKDMTERVRNFAPELETIYYKELFDALDETGKRLS